MIALASSKEEVIEVLKKDIYAENDVWDFSKVCFVSLPQTFVITGNEVMGHGIDY